MSRNVFIRVFSLLLICILFFPVYALSKTVALPLSVDYQLLRSLVIYTYFTDPNETAVLLDENNGCLNIIISEPIFTEENSHVRFETKVHVQAGIYLEDNCFMPTKWDGYVVLFLRPKIKNKKWILSFDAVDSILYNKHHKPAKIAGIIWKLVKTRVLNYLSNININLAPPISELKSFLRQAFPADLHNRAESMANLIRPGKVITTPDAVRVEILTDVEVTYKKKGDREQEIISREEMEKFIKTWEEWDSFLVHMITSLLNEPLSDNDRQILLDTLLETRHHFINELSDEVAERDFVRKQFVTVWKKLSPIFRNHLSDKPSENLLGYLAFFTASDALSTLDKIGPTLGIEISRNGLIRLARLLGKKEPDILSYPPGINEKLREILGLGPPLPAEEQTFDSDIFEFDIKEGESNRDDNDRLSNTIISFFIKPAWAEKIRPAIKFERIRNWIVSRKNLNSYLKRIKALLTNTSCNILKKSKIAEKYHDLYRLIILSTAWQESCFRQFKVKKGKVTYLRSYNGTSVGLMQVNERVWRGIYDQNHLRWDIQYNAMAGCEIVDLYLRKYALRKIKKMNLKNFLDNENLARIIYAMYNGGPKQFHKFLKRFKKGEYYLSDRLFLEKYSWVKNGQWQNIRECLIGQ